MVAGVGLEDGLARSLQDQTFQGSSSFRVFSERELRASWVPSFGPCMLRAGPSFPPCLSKRTLNLDYQLSMICRSARVAGLATSLLGRTP